MDSNLYSLLNGKWMIAEGQIPGMLLLLDKVLNNKMEVSNVVSDADYPFIVTNSGQVIRTVFEYNVPIFPDASEPFTLVYPIKSSIYKYNQACGPVGTTQHKLKLSRYLNNVNCQAVVLDIDSGGGQVSGTPAFYDFIKKAQKPIHAYTDGYMCSAAYYIASACQSITADPRAEKIGSIGALLHYIDWTGKIEKEGGKIVIEYATKSTKKNKSTRALDAGNIREYIKAELDPIVDTFITDVKNTRPDVDESVFTGEDYNPVDAKKVGLIDQVQNLDYLLNSLVPKTNSKKTDNNNPNSKSMKQFAALNAVLAVAMLEANDNGTFLNEEQLNTLNTALTEKDNIIATLQEHAQTSATQLAEAQTATQTATALQTSQLGTVATALGLATGATLETVTAKIAELNQKPANAHTSAQPNQNPPADDNDTNDIDMNAAHNKIANSIFN